MAQIDQENTSSLMEDIGEQIEIPHSLPMISVRDVVVFPYMIIPLFVGRDKSVRAVEEAMEKDAAGTQPREKGIFDTNIYPLKPRDGRS